MRQWNTILAAVATFSLPVIGGIVWRYRTTSDRHEELRIATVRQLSVVPIRQLTTAEVILNRTGCWATSNHEDLLERAEKAGPWAVLAVLPVGKAVKLAQYSLRVMAGGMAINELINAAVVRDAILQEVTVSVEYGINLDEISGDNLEIKDKSLILTLPAPGVIGTPNIDRERSLTIDRQTNGDEQDAEWPRLQQLAFEDAQQNAGNWVQDAGLETSLREQSRAVIREFVQSLIGKDSLVVVRFADEAKGGAS